MNRSLLRTQTSPIAVARSVRNHDIRVLTSLPAGKMVPIAAIPLFREDAVPSGRMRLSFEMMETAEILMNAINVNVKAYLVPNLAFERFRGMDDLNRAYNGVPSIEGQAPIPYIELIDGPEVHGEFEILTYMGKHARADQKINSAYIEAYNTIWNFRAKNRSPDITLRGRLDTDLAPAFWQHQGFAHIVPDFDQAVIDGEVPLNVVNARMPVTGIGTNEGAPMTNATVFESTGLQATYSHARPTNQQNLIVRMGSPEEGSLLQIFAELQDNGITVSLSNIELAKKTQAFAKLRQQYSGHTDEYIIDLLMDGITVPEQAYHQPILLSDRSTIFGMHKRYAADGENLTQSVVNGATYLDVGISLPKIPVGGVIMVVAEITPEQLFERQMDPYLHVQDVDSLPHYLRDTLDPEKVSVVKNEYIDLDHDTPDATFGYAPLNHEWNHTAPCIGGRFYRPEVDAAFDEDRQRIWAVETQNPTLSEDFYLCTQMHTKPFVVTNQDPFEVVVRGNVAITGNTVFGQMLIEANNDYDLIMDKAPMDRVAKSMPVEP